MSCRPVFESQKPMKPLAFSAIFVAIAPFTACSGGEVAPTVVTGAGMGSGATGGSTGGAGGAGGSTGGSTTGGTGGGTTGGTGGGTTGGTGGSSGSTAATGGSAGTGVATGGSAGTGVNPSGGMGPASGGMGPASGGMGPASGGMGPASGGMGPASGGMGPASGGMGATGGMGPTCPTIAELFPAAGNLDSLDGRLVTTPCSPTNSDDCSGGGWIYKGTTTGCSNGALTAQQDFAVGGTPGESYQVTLHFY